jgi:hypothetical protein
VRLAVISMDYGVFKGAKVDRRQRGWVAMGGGMTQADIILVARCSHCRYSDVSFANSSVLDALWLLDRSEGDVVAVEG